MAPPLQTLADWMDNDDNIIYLCNFGKTKDTKDKKIEAVNGKINGNTELKIYPNPVSDVLHVINPLAERLNIKMYDNMGKLVLDKSLLANDDVRLKDLNAGIYFIQIFNETGNMVLNDRILIVKK